MSTLTQDQTFLAMVNRSITETNLTNFNTTKDDTLPKLVSAFCALEKPIQITSFKSLRQRRYRKHSENIKLVYILFALATQLKLMQPNTCRLLWRMWEHHWMEYGFCDFILEALRELTFVEMR